MYVKVHVMAALTHHAHSYVYSIILSLVGGMSPVYESSMTRALTLILAVCFFLARRLELFRLLTYAPVTCRLMI